MLNDLASPATLIATRRSGKPRDMVAPGPSPAQLRRILMAAMRVPDHGKLAPWRFVTVADDRRDAFAAMLRAARLAERPDTGAAELDGIDQFARQAPALVVVVSTPREAAIPAWEQELSAGAACMAMLLAAHAEGLVGGWLTGWAAYSPAVAAAIGHPGARIAGFVFLGTAPREPAERPRPDYDMIVSDWRG